MTDLAAQRCEACRAGAPKVTDEELKELILQIPEWLPVTRDGILQLEREFKFKNFKQALAFTNQVGETGRSRRSPPCPAHRMGQSDHHLVDA